MNYKIIRTNFGPHRDTEFTATINLDFQEDGKRYYEFNEIDGIEMIVAELADKKWWIICNNPDDEKRSTDVGPFDDADTAVVYLKLSATVTRIKHFH